MPRADLSPRPRLAFVLLASAVIAVVGAPAHAEPLFSAPSLQFETGHTPTGFGVADLDGDGDLDLAVASSGAYSTATVTTVSILLGNGDGTFAPRVDYETGWRPQTVAIADLDGDGHLDLAVVCYGVHDARNGVITVLRGIGDGTFHARVDYPAGRWLRSIVLADVNGDGDLDAVTERSVLLGNGDGTFQPKVEFGGDETVEVAVADFDGDGHLDVATANRHASPPEEEDPGPSAVQVRLGNGDGTFGGPQSFGFGWSVYAVAAGDLDGDGKQDLAWASLGSSPDDNGSVSVARGNGDGTFGPQSNYLTAENPISLAIGPIDADAIPDLAVSNYGFDRDFDSNSVSVLLGNGDATFRVQPPVAVGEDPRGVTIADVNGDGAADLITADEIPSTVSVVLGAGDGTFGRPDLPVDGTPHAVESVDLDGDGREDLVVMAHAPSASTTQLLVFRALGDGGFAPPVAYASGFGAISMTAADFNGDGRPDVAVVNYQGLGAGTVSVLLGAGDGTLLPRVAYPAGDNTHTITSGDLTGDGVVDLVVTNLIPNTISILPGFGDGTFGARTTVPTGSSPNDVALADLDGDGRLDVVTANTDGPNGVSVLLRDPDGAFQPKVDYAVPGGGQNRRPLAITDLDGDGDLDLVAGGAVLLGAGGGLFAGATPYGWQYPGGLVAADFDGDGISDVAAVHDDLSGPVMIHLGTGSGGFHSPIRFGVGPQPSAVAVGDFDGDGRPDLAVTNGVGRSVSILLNTFDDDSTPTWLSRFEGRWTRGGNELRWQLGVELAWIEVVLERADAEAGPWSAVTGERRRDGEATVVIDRAVEPGVAFFYRLRAVGAAGAVMVSAPLRVASPAPTGTVSLAVAPNPVDHAAVVRFTLLRAGHARVSVHDVQGRQVRVLAEGAHAAGDHETPWTGSRLAPGLYLVRIESAGQRAVRRVVVTR